MLKKLTTILICTFLIVLNANAGSDGVLSLKENQTKETKDCF